MLCHVFHSLHLLHLLQPLSGLYHLQLLRRAADGDADERTELVVALLPEEELAVVDHSDDLSTWKWRVSASETQGTFAAITFFYQQ